MSAGGFNARTQFRTFRGGRGGFRNPNRSRNGFAKDETCFNCGERGHWKNECPQPTSNAQGRFNRKTPFNSMRYSQQSAPPPPLDPFYNDERQSALTGPHIARAECQMP